ncbi:hypothetical protein [Streptomyces griseocarneus]|uniref:hypothetical protein n=1 Tax=Streptomyces griseocarneus TaxID=51201 RepID=UPI00167C5739|nr:hypothetical protein [Streptomyces griseocarneus]MBZ6474211.1 hypothetical protein [Streptomyces griseocarneus]GHG52626.1 hypothetical protein GCM10018779_14030 [Streptomyces griseocarneus]
MRTNKLTAVAAALISGSLTLGIAGPALAAGKVPDPVIGQEPAPGGADRGDPVDGFGETVSLGSRFSKEARSRNPDVEYLRDLRQRLMESTDRLMSDVRARAHANDPVGDVKAQLDKLVKDVTDLLAAVLAKDVAKVTALVATVVADLQALLLSVPKLVTDAAPLPVPLPV